MIDESNTSPSLLPFYFCLLCSSLEDHLRDRMF